MGYCAICNQPVEDGDAIVHLRVEHGIEEDIQRWPDGEPVIVDSTLKPTDFEPDGRNT